MLEGTHFGESSGLFYGPVKVPPVLAEALGEEALGERSGGQEKTRTEGMEWPLGLGFSPRVRGEGEKSVEVFHQHLCGVWASPSGIPHGPPLPSGPQAAPPGRSWRRV